MLLICCIAVSSFFILKNLKEGKEQEQTFNDLTEIIENNEEDKSGDKEKINLLLREFEKTRKYWICLNRK